METVIEAIKICALVVLIFTWPALIALAVQLQERWRINMEGKEEKKPETSKPPPRTCPFCCESYHRGRVGVRACLAGRWDERDFHNKPLLRADTLEPVVPDDCGILDGDILLLDIFRKARLRGWR